MSVLGLSAHTLAAVDATGQTEEGEALRDDENFSYVAAWEYAGDDIQNDAVLNKEPLEFEYVPPTQRSYK